MTRTMPDRSSVKSALALAVRAPSVHNTQPWRWEIGDRTVHRIPNPALPSHLAAVEMHPRQPTDEQVALATAIGRRCVAGAPRRPAQPPPADTRHRRSSRPAEWQP